MMGNVLHTILSNEEKINKHLWIQIRKINKVLAECLSNEIDLGCTCPLFESNSSRDASGDTGHHMTEQNRNPNSI